MNKTTLETNLFSIIQTVRDERATVLEAAEKSARLFGLHLKETLEQLLKDEDSIIYDYDGCSESAVRSETIRDKIAEIERICNGK